MSGATEGSRLYRLLLCVVPRDFRERRGASMEQAFVNLRRSARERGSAAVVWLYVTECWDLARTGSALRRRAWRVGAVLDDVRLAVRMVVRHRGFFAFSSVTFALGIGATTATFSALKSLVLDPLPFPGAERAVLVWRTIGSGWFSPNEAETEALAADREVFETIALFAGETVVLTGNGPPAQLSSVGMGPSLASFMGVQPVLGRGFAASEYEGDGSRVLLLSHALWRGQYGGSRDVLGRTLQLNGEAWTVIGVMPPDAVWPNGAPGRVDVWVPLAERARYRQLVARLRPGVTLEAASAHVGDVFRRVSGKTSYGARVTSATALRSGALQEPLRVLMIAVTLLLLIACVNVSNLLLHRVANREREMALLSALGAVRSRLFRQFLMESVVLALWGGLLGTLLAAGLVRAVQRLRPADLAALEMVRLDAGALGFSLLVSTCAGLLFGWLPSVRATRAGATVHLARARREGELGQRGFRWALVAVEVALSFALLAGASQLIVSLRSAALRDPGFRAEGLLDVTITLPSWRYVEPTMRRLSFEQMADAIRRLPHIEGVALGQGSPPESGIYFGVVQVEGKAAEPEASMFHGTAISPEYLGVAGQALTAGRSFTAAEMTDSANVVILGETSARRLFPEGGAVGQRFSLGGGPPQTVVGVVRDAALGGLSARSDVDIAYWPLGSVPASLHMLARTTADDAGLASRLRETVRAIEPDALVELHRAEELLRRSLARERLTTTLLSGFAALAALLAAVGLYSVLSQIVAARTHEIGVRVSLGADSARIRQMVLRSGLTATGIGLVAGGVLLAAGLQLLRSRMFGLTAHAPLAWIAAALVLAVVSLIAVWRPAERAARTDPMVAMRAD